MAAPAFHQGFHRQSKWELYERWSNVCGKCAHVHWTCFYSVNTQLNFSHRKVVEIKKIWFPCFPPLCCRDFRTFLAAPSCLNFKETWTTTKSHECNHSCIYVHTCTLETSALFRGARRVAEFVFYNIFYFKIY